MAWRTGPIDPVETFMPTPPGSPRRKADRLVVNMQERGASERSRGWLRVSLYSVGEVQSVPIYPVERKLAAIFAADIAGYSRLMGRDEIGTLALG
jgi:class 3 adenylate cyclase